MNSNTKTPEKASVSWWWFFLGVVGLLFTGCAAPRDYAPARPFVFGQDTFSFENELKWVYYQDDAGRWQTRNREPAPTYSLHCFPVSRAAKEFFLNARFDPSLPAADEKEKRRLVRKVVATDSRNMLPEAEKIVIPGYSNLTSFSRENEILLKKECGSGVSSYFQRGHWRMVLPFGPRQRRSTAERFFEMAQRNQPAVAHMVTFPKLSINHAVLVYGAKRTGEDIEFSIYDPNNASSPGSLLYKGNEKAFYLPALPYFHGGKVQVYEVFHQWNY